MMLVAAVSFGIFEAVTYLTRPGQVLVIGDDVTSTTPTTASSPPVFGNTVSTCGEEMTVWAPGLWVGVTAGVGKDM